MFRMIQTPRLDPYTKLAPLSPMIMDFQSYMSKDKKDQLKLSSHGMVKKTISKKNPKKVWVNLGLCW